MDKDTFVKVAPFDDRLRLLADTENFISLWRTVPSRKSNLRPSSARNATEEEVEAERLLTGPTKMRSTKRIREASTSPSRSQRTSEGVGVSRDGKQGDRSPEPPSERAPPPDTCNDLM